MPHSGGGGGSHGGSFSSSGSSSAPRYDNHGHLHSPYYVRPGFYYRNTYVPYHTKGRLYSVLSGPIFFLLFSCVFLFISFAALNSERSYSYSEDKISEYSMSSYYDFYNSKDQNFEYNVVLTFVKYDNLVDYDYWTTIGDDVAYQVDTLFSSSGRTLSKIIKEKIGTTGYQDSLSQDLVDVINALTDCVSEKYYSENTLNSSIANHSDIVLNESKINLALSEFFNKSGYNLCIEIADYKEVFAPDYLSVAIFILVSLLFVGCGVFLVVRQYKIYKTIKQAELDGTEEKYFEGEEPFNIHSKMYDKTTGVEVEGYNPADFEYKDE